MANLPNKSFVFNFNAKNYVSSTRTIPNESGASMNMDMVWSGTTATARNNIAFDTDHISIPLSAYSIFNFSTSGANPMNNTTTAPALTIVAKFKVTNTSSGANFLNNRDNSTYNYFARCGGGYLSFGTLGGGNSGPAFDTGSTVIAVWQVNSSRSITIKNITSGTSTNIGTTTWNGGTKWFTFFCWKRGTSTTSTSTSVWGEFMSGDFYWCYASREVLTDAEIQQVIKFNEGGGISIDSTGTTIVQSGGTSTANIDADTGWTVTSSPSWVTVSPASGESGTTAIAFTIKKNNFSSRTGVVVFTDDGGNEAEYTIEQGGTENQLPYNKIYRNDRRIN